MNIFILDEDMETNVKYYMDCHVRKMVLETAQLLCSTFYFDNGDYIPPYKLTHGNNKCALWTRESLSNWLYLRDLGLAIGKEYTYRYGKTHASELVIRSLPVPNIEDKGLTPFVNQIKPQYIICKDTVVNYRNYYCSKSHLAKWTKREKPFWYKEEDVRVKEIEDEK